MTMSGAVLQLTCENHFFTQCRNAETNNKDNMMRMMRMMRMIRMMMIMMMMATMESVTLKIQVVMMLEATKLLYLFECWDIACTCIHPAAPQRA